MGKDRTRRRYPKPQPRQPTKQQPAGKGQSKGSREAWTEERERRETADTPSSLSAKGHHSAAVRRGWVRVGLHLEEIGSAVVVIDRVDMDGVMEVVVVVVAAAEEQEEEAEAGGRLVPRPSELKDCPDERLRIRAERPGFVKKWPASPSTNL